MGKRSYAAISNRLIEDKELTHSAKRILVAMALASHKGVVKGRTISRLASLSGCSRSTVQTGIQALEARGYIEKINHYRYSLTMGQVVRDWNEYRIILKDTESYTLIPRNILSYAVTASCFVVMLYLYRCAGRRNRAYPSIRYMAGELKARETGCGVSKASVCRALAILKKLRFFVKLMCHRLRGDLASTSYMPFGIVVGHREEQPVPVNTALTEVEATASPALAPAGGWSQNWYTPLINKITKGYIRRKREIGVFQFSKMYNLFGVLAKIPFLSKYMARPPTADR